MTEVLSQAPLDQERQPPTSFTEFQAQYPDAPVELHDNARRLAQERGEQIPQFEQDAIEATKESLTKSHDWSSISEHVPITDGHQDAHDDMGRSLDKDYDKRTRAERYAIDVSGEIGKEAIDTDMAVEQQATEAERSNQAAYWLDGHEDGFDVSDIPASCADEVVMQVLHRPGVLANPLAHDIARHIGNAPQLSAETIKDLLVLNAGSKMNIFNLALRFPKEVSTTEAIDESFTHTDQILDLIHTKPELMTALKNNVRLSKGNFVPIEVFDRLKSDAERSEFLHHVAVIESETADTWLKDMSYAVIRLDAIGKGFGEVRAGAINHNSNFKPEDNDITHIPIPLASALNTEAKPPMKMFGDMSAEEQSMVTTKSFAEKLEQGTLDGSNIALPDLKPEYQELVVGAALANAAELSQSKESQAAASNRNGEIARSGAYIANGDLVHTSSVDSLSEVLAGGLVCGELIGEESNNDAYPLNVDFNVITSADMQQDGFQAKVKAMTAGRHGTHINTSVTYVLRRGDANQTTFPDRPAQTSDSSHKHRLIFGAVPSTEISSIIVAQGQDDNEDRALQARVLKDVLGQNVYYPILSTQGELLLTPDEFEQGISKRLTELQAQGTSAYAQPDSGTVSSRKVFDVPFEFLPPTMPGFGF